MPTPKIPTMAEAKAAEKSAAGVYLTWIEGAEALMNGPEAQAFEAAVAAFLEADRPDGTSAAVNLPRVQQWFNDVKAGIAADKATLDRIVNPPAPLSPAA